MQSKLPGVELIAILLHIFKGFPHSSLRIDFYVPIPISPESRKLAQPLTLNHHLLAMNKRVFLPSIDHQNVLPGLSFCLSGCWAELLCPVRQGAVLVL